MNRADRGKRQALEAACAIMDEPEWEWDADAYDGPEDEAPLLHGGNAEAFRTFAIETYRRDTDPDVRAEALLDWFGHGAFSQGMRGIMRRALECIMDD